MFKWFKKDKNKVEDIKDIKIDKVEKVNNYETDDNGDIKIQVREYDSYYYYCSTNGVVIPKASIISHTAENIIFTDYVERHNHSVSLRCGLSFLDYCQTIEHKENFVKYKDEVIKILQYKPEYTCWALIHTKNVASTVASERTPLEVFKEEFKSEYKLIETEDEFNEYLSSTLDCDTWCRMKLYNKMKELELGDGFINQFADLVGNDLDKYHAMINLAGEVADKDTLMYLYTYKFGSNLSK